MENGKNETSARLESELRKGAFEALKILNKYSELGFDYRVVGGLALSATVGEDIKFVRSNGSIRDIDLIVFSYEINMLNQMKHEIEQKKKEGFRIPYIEFNFIRESKDSSQLQLIGMFKRRTDGKLVLSFRSVELEVPEIVITPVKYKFKNANKEVEFTSFSVMTILHLYLKRSASLKEKDYDKIKEAAEKVSENAKVSFLREHEPYKVFHQFVKEVKSKHPFHAKVLQFYNYVDGIFLGGISHKLIPKSIWDKIVNP